MKNLNLAAFTHSSIGRAIALLLVMSLLALCSGQQEAHAESRVQLTIADAAGPVTNKTCIPMPAAFLGDGFSPSETGYNKTAEGNIISFTSKARDVDRFREYRDLVSAAYPFEEITTTVNDYGGTGFIGEYTFYSLIRAATSWARSTPQSLTAITATTARPFSSAFRLTATRARPACSYTAMWQSSIPTTALYTPDWFLPTVLPIPISAGSAAAPESSYVVSARALDTLAFSATDTGSIGTARSATAAAL